VTPFYCRTIRAMKAQVWRLMRNCSPHVAFRIPLSLSFSIHGWHISEQSQDHITGYRSDEIATLVKISTINITKQLILMRNWHENEATGLSTLRR